MTETSLNTPSPNRDRSQLIKEVTLVVVLSLIVTGGRFTVLGGLDQRLRARSRRRAISTCHWSYFIDKASIPRTLVFQKTHPSVFEECSLVSLLVFPIYSWDSTIGKSTTWE